MNRPPLLLAGHGTRDPAGVTAFTAFTARLEASLALQGIEVTGGFIELSDPPLRDAVTELTGRGHRRVVAVPLVLSAASHAKSDIPAALARERARHPGPGLELRAPARPAPGAAGIAGGADSRAGPMAGRPADSRTARAALTGPAPPGPPRPCCWSRAGPPTRTPTPRYARPRGCSGKAGTTRSPRRRSCRWRTPACKPAWSDAACWEPAGSSWPGTSCSPASCRTG